MGGPLTTQDVDAILDLVQRHSGTRPQISDVRDARKGRQAPDRGVQVVVRYGKTNRPRSGSLSLYIINQDKANQWTITDVIAAVS